MIYMLKKHIWSKNSFQKENFALNLRRFTYSWITNRLGTAWNIIKNPCEAAYQTVYGSPSNEWPSMRSFIMPDIDNFFHDSNCGGVNEPLYPCADLYDGFNSTTMNLDMCKFWYPSLMLAASNCKLLVLYIFLAVINTIFFLGRKPKQALGTIILPLMVIGILSVFGALIPYSTGEKYGYLITVFLALVFYLELLSSEIAPAGENDLPLILYVMYTTAAILLYSILATIFWGKKIR